MSARRGRLAARARARPRPGAGPGDDRPPPRRPGVAPRASLAPAALPACFCDPPTTGPSEGEGRPRIFGGERPVELQLPAAFDEGRSYPLVLVLHAFGSTPAEEIELLDLAGIDADPGVFVLAPEGLPATDGRLAWNACPACCGDTESDDVAYLGGVVDEVVAAWPIDPAQVFAVGRSNGHFMAYRLACDRADRFTAIAGLAGAATSVDGSGCAPASPVSTLHIHGDADGVIRYEGGWYDAPYPGAVATTALWAEHDGCDVTFEDGGALDLVDALPGAETAISRAQGCPAGVDVELWTIAGGNHRPLLIPGTGARIVTWLMDHPRR
ncbi:MAG: hypothetical protein H6710_24545 [Myxococcales bacterium]|nr:hypothetical protein [Myxococcales bacterium]